jgi:hypothetical protein
VPPPREYGASEFSRSAWRQMRLHTAVILNVSAETSGLDGEDGPWEGSKGDKAKFPNG